MWSFAQLFLFGLKSTVHCVILSVFFSELALLVTVPAFVAMHLLFFRGSLVYSYQNCQCLTSGNINPNIILYWLTSMCIEKLLGTEMLWQQQPAQMYLDHCSYETTIHQLEHISTSPFLAHNFSQQCCSM